MEHNRNMKTNGNLLKLCLLGLGLLLPATVRAQFTFTTNNGSITITGYSGSDGTIIIPDTTNGYPVTSIGYDVFSYNPDLTNVTIPDSIVTIDDLAFLGCFKMTKVTLGLGVKSIGSYAFSDSSLTDVQFPTNLATIGTNAFSDCYSLTSISIPNSVVNVADYAFDCCDHMTNVVIGIGVTNIGFAAFDACYALSAITVDTSNTAYSSDDGILFDKNQTIILLCPNKKTGSFTIPNSMHSIGFAAFAGSHLTNIIMGASITNIGASAFACPWLSNITIGSNVMSIGNYSFYSCESLTTITMPSSVTGIGDEAFLDCTNLTSIFFMGDAPTNVAMNIFTNDLHTTVYYLPGTMGWKPTFAGRPTALWLPQLQTSGGSFGVQTNQFGFNINWASGQTVVVEASTNLSNPIWQPVQTNTLTSGTAYFSDSQWTNYPGRFYRLRSP